MQLGVIENGTFRSQNASPDFKDCYDTIVVGLGTAGTEAALVAASLGLKTLGVEKMIAMGGQSTLGCVWFKSKGKAEEPNPATVLKNHHISFPIQKMSIPERMFLYECEADEAKLDISYETIVTGVYLEGNTVKGLRLCRNGISCDIAARIVMDCTGNCAISHMAGCRIIVGREFDHGQAAISKAVYWEAPDGSKRPRYTFFRDNTFVSADEYSKTIVSLSQGWPGLWEKRQNRVLQEALILGAREEGHVETEEMFSLRDSLMGTPVSQPVFHTFVPLDLVRVDEDWAFENEDVQNWKVLCGVNCFGFSASLPYGSLLPKKIAALLVPSKHFGVAHDAGSGIRMESDMRKTGYISACAAYLSISLKVPLKEVPYERLKEMLDAGGVPAMHRKQRVTLYNGPFMDIFSDDDVIEALKQDVTPPDSWIFRVANGPRERSAYAFYTAWEAALRRSPAEQKVLANKLFAEMEKKGRFSGNFAIALGLMGDRRACPLLRSMVGTPGNANPDGCDPVITDAYPNRIKALSLLGRLGDRESIPLLRDLISDYAKTFTADLPLNGKQKKTQEQYQFAALSFALFSIVSLRKRYPDPNLRQHLLDWSRRPFVLPAGQRRYDCAPMLVSIISKSLT